MISIIISVILLLFANPLLHKYVPINHRKKIFPQTDISLISPRCRTLSTALSRLWAASQRHSGRVQHYLRHTCRFSAVVYKVVVTQNSAQLQKCHLCRILWYCIIASLVFEKLIFLTTIWQQNLCFFMLFHAFLCILQKITKEPYKQEMYDSIVGGPSDECSEKQYGVLFFSTRVPARWKRAMPCDAWIRRVGRRGRSA